MTVLALVEHADGKASDPSLQALTLARSFGEPVHMRSASCISFPKGQ